MIQEHNIFILEKCLSLNSSTLSFTYIISNKNNVTIGPNNKITAKSNCLPGFVPPNGVQLPDLVCLNGQWDNTPVECVSNIATSKKLSSNTGK